MIQNNLDQPKLIFQPQFIDHRGIFLTNSLNGIWVQHNISISKRGTIRGMHFQLGNSAQAKLVRILNGAVIDVIVDLRNLPDNTNYLKVHVYYLTSYTNTHNRACLYVPKGFAHGFLALEENTIFEYKVNAPYNTEMGRGINWQSFPIFNEALIKHNIQQNELLISDKDKLAPYLNEWLEKNENVLSDVNI